MKRKKVWWTVGSGRIELQMTIEQAQAVSHSGDCLNDVRALVRTLNPQLEKFDPALIAKELREYGAWSTAELANHGDNLERLVWIAGCDISEESHNVH